MKMKKKRKKRKRRSWLLIEGAIDQAGLQGDSDSEQLPSAEDPLTRSGSPSNRIDNSGTAARCSLRANKFTIQRRTDVLKQNQEHPSAFKRMWPTLERDVHVNLKEYCF